MSDRLDVRLFDQHIGEVAMMGTLRSPEDWRFSYSAEYVNSDRPVPLSVSLPLQTETFNGAVVRNWFCNLLPEGVVRQSIEMRLRIPSRDDFSLLAAIGGECAGAVSVGISASAESQKDNETNLETLLMAASHDAGEGVWASLGAPHRLSLAGAQDKIAVVRDAEGCLRLPAIGEISTHILKPDSQHIRGTYEMEALGLALARAAGLNAANAEMIDVAGRKALLIERYDRIIDDTGIVQRLHQEDFCQALGYPGELKYESQGGPSLAACANLIRHHLRLGPKAVQGFLDWVVFCAVIGNADAHAKNLALLYGRDGKRSLAPFYDLVPTIAIAETLVDRTPALRIGAAQRIDNLTQDNWRDFARAAGYSPKFVLDRVRMLSGVMLESIQTTAGLLVASGAGNDRMKKVVAAIRQNAQQLRIN